MVPRYLCVVLWLWLWLFDVSGIVVVPVVTGDRFSYLVSSGQWFPFTFSICNLFINFVSSRVKKKPQDANPLCHRFCCHCRCRAVVVVFIDVLDQNASEMIILSRHSIRSPTCPWFLIDVLFVVIELLRVSLCCLRYLAMSYLTLSNPLSNEWRGHEWHEILLVGVSTRRKVATQTI